MERINEVVEQLIPTRELTRVELKNILSQKNFPDMTSFISNTKVDMKKFLDYWIETENGKKKNPNPIPNLFFEKGIWKLSKKYQIVTGFDYEKSVNNRLESEGKEGNFESEENWFEPISKSLVTDKKTHSKFYYRYQYTDNSTVWKEYYYNGDVVEEELFKSYMTEKKNSYDKQGLEKPLKFQVCDLNNLVTLSMGGEVYRLVGEV